MSELNALMNELERQDRELAERFEELRQLDPSMEIAVSPEWLAELGGEAPAHDAPVGWESRA